MRTNTSWIIACMLSVTALVAGAEIAPPVRTSAPQANADPRITLKDDAAGGRFSIHVDGAEALVYRYGKEVAIPYFDPVWSPSGKAMTIASTTPFPHHQSFWFADAVQLKGHRRADFYKAYYSRVNAKDTASPFRDQIVHVAFLEEKRLAPNQLETGMKQVCMIDRKTPVLDQEQRMRVVTLGSGEYFLDVTYRVTASYDEVRFVSDAAHYAWPYLRMHPQFSVAQGGRLTNSEGGINFKGTNDKVAHWVDCSNNIGGTSEGLTIFSHSDNAYPHSWLTRDYGTFGPRRPAERNGKPFMLAKGDSLVWRVGILVHTGDVTSGQVAARYAQYLKGRL